VTAHVLFSSGVFSGQSPAYQCPNDNAHPRKTHPIPGSDGINIAAGRKGADSQEEFFVVGLRFPQCGPSGRPRLSALIISKNTIHIDLSFFSQEGSVADSLPISAIVPLCHCDVTPATALGSRPTRRTVASLPSRTKAMGQP